MRILATGTAVDRANANLLAYEALKERIPETYTLESEQITFTLDEEDVRMDGRNVIMDVTASAPLVVDIDRSKVRSAVAGLKADEAVKTLGEQFTLDAPAAVELSPNWIKRWAWLERVPLLPFRIQVVVLE